MICNHQVVSSNLTGSSIWPVPISVVEQVLSLTSRVQLPDGSPKCLRDAIGRHPRFRVEVLRVQVPSEAPDLPVPELAYGTGLNPGVCGFDSRTGDQYARVAELAYALD